MLVHLGWTGGEPPKAFCDAVERARAASPECEVMSHVGDDAVPERWRNAMDSMGFPPHMRSDIQRHCILKEYGGLWLDADVRILADPAKWAAQMDRYTAIRLMPMNGGLIGTDIIYVPRGWRGWSLIDEHIDGFFASPPKRINVLHFAGWMIEMLAKRSPDDFAILPMRPFFPYGQAAYTPAAVVARGFDPPADKPGLGDMVADGLAAIGITKERVQAVASAVGIKDCGCAGRQKALNRLGQAIGLPPGRQNKP